MALARKPQQDILVRTVIIMGLKGDSMGRNVIVNFKIMPESPETNLEEIEKKIREMNFGNITDVKVEPIAFGLKAIRMLMILPDEGNIADETQEKIKNIEGIHEVEIDGVTLI